MSHERLIRELLASGVSLIDNPFRLGSEKWCEFVREARSLYNDGALDELDVDSFELLESYAGEIATYNGEPVVLEVPMANHDRPGWYFVHTFDGKEVRLLEFEASVTDSGTVTE